jgi:bifunctional DNase/RNase
MIQVEVINTFLVNKGKEFILLLKGEHDDRTLPISIGQLEAQSIAIHLNRIPFPRPLTHDLFRNVINELGGKVVRTEICDLKDETFYARLIIGMGDTTMCLDARPSDAIALAMRFSAPIFVEETVLDEAGVVIPATEQQPAEKSAAAAGDAAPGNPPPIEILRKRLEAAITEERYEDAAHLRDEINNHTASN